MSEKTLLQRVLVFLSAFAFLGGSTGLIVASLFSGSSQQPQETTNTAVASGVQELQSQERGYESVLEREPENQAALQGLVEIRLQMNDFEGAIAPMEKLVELYPEQQEYQALLVAIKQQVGEESEK